MAEPKQESVRTPIPASIANDAAVECGELRRLGSVLPWTVWTAPLLLPLLAGGLSLMGLGLGLWAYGHPYDPGNAVWRVAMTTGGLIGLASVGGTVFLLVLNLYFTRVAVSPRLPQGGHRFRTSRGDTPRHEMLRLRYSPGLLELVDGEGELVAACVCMLEFAFDGRRSLDERFGALQRASRELQLLLEVRVPAADPRAEVCHDFDPRRDSWFHGVEHE